MEDSPITSAKFKLPTFCKFFRISVSDIDDKKVYTNAYKMYDINN